MNPIKNIEIKNFKSIRHQKIDGCKKINVFIGYPNVGKSNILEAIGLYSSFRLIGEGFKFNDICRVKRFSELFFNKDYRSATNVVLNDKLRLELIINRSNNLDIRIENINKLDAAKNLQVYDSTVDSGNYNYLDNRPINELAYKGVAQPIRKYEFRSGGVINLKAPLALSIPFGANLLEVFHNDSILRKEIANLFEDYNQKLVIDDEEIFFLKYLNDDSAVSIPYHLVSDTLRRLIFYKAAILSNRDSVLLLEEPEAHMFPPYIRKFTTDVIFDKTNQYFIATHSPYVLDTFMEEASEDLSIYLVYYQEGETKIKKMSEKDMEEVNEYGVDLFYNLESYLKHGQVNNA
jgi:AAA15 family ATPase/GTPase